MKLSIGIIIQLFLIGGFIGLIYESVSYSFGCSKDGPEKKWALDAIRAPENSYFRYKGSINPLAIIPGSIMNGLVYGTGIILIILVNQFIPTSIPIYIRIIIFGLIAALLEFIVGIIANRDYSQWDYRKNFGNIKGQTDLYHILLWTIGSSLFVFLILPKLYPFMDKVNNWGTKHILLTVFLLLLASFMTYSTEKNYVKGKEPIFVKIFNSMEPNFPPKREQCD